jgi:hypothetical protein
MDHNEGQDGGITFQKEPTKFNTEGIKHFIPESKMARLFESLSRQERLVSISI